VIETYRKRLAKCKQIKPTTEFIPENMAGANQVMQSVHIW